MDQDTLNKAVDIATRSATQGCPVDQIIWIAPTTPAQGKEGCFAILYKDKGTPATEVY